MKKINIDLLQKEIIKCKKKLYQIACVEHTEDFVKTFDIEYDFDDIDNEGFSSLSIRLGKGYCGDEEVLYVTVSYSEINEPLSYFIKKKEEKERKLKERAEQREREQREKETKEREEKDWKTYQRLKEKFEKK